VEFEAEVRGGVEEGLGAKEAGTAVEEGGREEPAELESDDSKRRVALSAEGDDCDADAEGDNAKATEAPTMQTCSTSVFAMKKRHVVSRREADHSKGNSKCRRHSLAFGARDYFARGRGLHVAQQRLLHGVLSRFHRLRLAAFFPIVIPKRIVDMQILCACDTCEQRAPHLNWDSSTTSMVM
jgi:hypothetical protein